MWAWSVSLNLDNWPALRARFNSERTQVISGSNHGFKDRSTVRQSNPSKFYRCGTMQVQIWISTYVILKTIYFIWFFFFCISLSRHTPQELKRVQKRVVSHGRNQQKTRVCTCQDALWAQMCCELSWQFHLLVFHARLCRVCRRSAGTGRVITRRDWSGGVVKHKKGEGEKQLSFAKISAASGASQTGLRIKTSQLWDFSFHQASFCCAVPCQSLRGVDWAMHF